MGRQFWNTIRQAIRIDKIKESLTIPVASYTTFRRHGCIEYSVSDNNDNRFISSFASTTAFTAELWFKPLSQVSVKQVLLLYGETVSQFELSILNNVLTARVWKGAVPTSVSATGYFSTYSWNHVAVTYDNATINLFVNGIKVASGALVGPTDSFIVFAHLGQSGPTTDQFIGRIGELRVWNVARTEEQILSFYQNPRNVGMDDVTGLVDYYKLNGVSINGAGNEQNQVNTLQTLTASSSKLTTEDHPPLIFGASFVATEFPLSLGYSFSFLFPVSKPDGCTGMLVVRWIESDGTVQRRRFWDLTGVDINPMPEIYSGESIHTVSALEWWNIDGNQTLEVPTAIVLRTSKCTNPTSSFDSTAQVAATLTPDTTLGEPYPLTYPLTFNTAQAYT